eukprot:6802105-Pyramimonas_sp.AAC.1
MTPPTTATAASRSDRTPLRDNKTQPTYVLLLSQRARHTQDIQRHLGADSTAQHYTCISIGASDDAFADLAAWEITE